MDLSPSLWPPRPPVQSSLLPCWPLHRPQLSLSHAEQQVENAAELWFLRALPGGEFAASGGDEVDLIRPSDRRHQKVEEPAEDHLHRAKQNEGSPSRSHVPVVRVDVGHAAHIAPL